MLGSGDHYVPILKSKAAEISALSHLGPLDKGRITPLIEILPDQVSSEEKLKKFARKVVHSFGSNDPVFIDVSVVETKKAVLEQVKDAGIKVIPVVSQDDGTAYHKLIRSFERVCLRLDVDRLFSDQQPDKIPLLLGQLNKRAPDIDLMIDFGPIPQRSAPRNSEIAKILFGQLPFLNEWHSVFVSSTSFPTDLSSLQKDTASTIPREDWHMFLRLRSSVRAPIIGFSDYAIQHPSIAKLDQRIISVSTQLRITQRDDWLLIKGRSIKTEGFDYIRAVCRKAVREAQPTPNADFCWGDKFILGCAAGEEGTGNAGTWRQAGFSRHFAIVLNQLGDL